MVLAWCGLPGWPEISSLPLCTWIILHCAAADNLDNWDNLWIIRSCARRTAPACRAPRCLKHSQAASVCASASHVCFMIYHLSRALKFWTRFFFGSCQKLFDVIFFKKKSFYKRYSFLFCSYKGQSFFGDDLLNKSGWIQSFNGCNLEEISCQQLWKFLLRKISPAILSLLAYRKRSVAPNPERLFLEKEQLHHHACSAAPPWTHRLLIKRDLIRRPRQFRALAPGAL